MLKKDIYIGNINIIKNNEVVLYQKSCPLLSLGNGKFINLEWINTAKDYLKFYIGTISGDFSDELILSDRINDEVFVDKNSLVPYYNENFDEQISVSKVNEEFLLDPRIPRGVCLNSDGSTLIYAYKPNPKKIS